MGIGLKRVEFTQPDVFEFSAESKERAKKVIARYPAGREQSAVMPLLMIAQQQHEGWLPQAAIEYIASVLGMPPIKVKEVASFYTMYNLQPVGQFHIQVCGTTPCGLRGAEAIIEACKSQLGIGLGETTEDGKFTLSEVECLGACVNAPVMEVTTARDDGYYEDLTPHLAQELIDKMASGSLPAYGSVIGREGACPETGATTLILDSGKAKKTAAKKAAPTKKITPKKTESKKAVPAKKAKAAAKKTSAKKGKK